jgi:hypothetical protein
MAQFQINVATAKPTLDWQGVQQYAHLFRTDWMDDIHTARKVMIGLRAAWPDAAISLYQRDVVTTSVE